MSSVVSGVILDESVVLALDKDGEDGFSLQPGVESLLRRLCLSRIPTGISNEPDLSAKKVDLLKKLAASYSIDFFSFNLCSIGDATRDIRAAWGENGGSILYVVSENKKDFLRNSSLLIVILKVMNGNEYENSSFLYVSRLGELPLTICDLIKKAGGNEILKIGYIMKPSREEDFAKRGAFPMYPTRNGLIFVPLTFELPLSSQLQGVDLVLHKATDEIIFIDLDSSDVSRRVTFSQGMQELKRYLEHDTECCVLDPFDKVYPVLDRLEIQHILSELRLVHQEGHHKIRGPYFLKVDSFSKHLITSLSEAKLLPPCIVKPQVACGVADAHSMAIVFRAQDFKDLKVPCPAIIQEYVDHSSILYKFYVLGEQVFYAVKKSTPNGHVLMQLSESNGLKPLVFDSLKSLPTATGTQSDGDDLFFMASVEFLDLDLVNGAAKWLSEKLGLTIFGFDVVVQEGSRDHVIVDVNYLPSFKEVPDDIAIPAFWHAIKRRFEQRMN